MDPNSLHTESLATSLVRVSDVATAMLVTLREGVRDAPLFFFSQGGDELVDLASRIRSPRAVIGVEFWQRDDDGQFPTTVAVMADRSCSAIRALQSRGPYRLVGYSLGGLIAIEVARLLRGAGKEVALLGLIETRFDRQFWPTAIVFRSAARRIVWRLRGLLRSTPDVSKLCDRARRLVARPLKPQSRPILAPPEAKTPSANERCLTALRDYRPKRYDGKLSLFNAENIDDLHCNPAELWRDLASEIECRTIPATHFTIIRDATSLTILAAALDRCLDETHPASGRNRVSGPAPRVLLLTAQHWLTTTRLALALSQAGFIVESVCPAGHSLTRVKFVTSTYRYRALSPLRSIREAIETSKPDLVIPSDEYMAAHLHNLYALARPADCADANLRALIARSLGDPEQLPILHARNEIASVAGATGVRSPTTAIISNEVDLSNQLGTIGYPAVLKTDGSSGGLGVAVVHNQADSKRAFRRLAAPPSIVRAIKRLIIDRDANLVLPCLQRFRSHVTVQRFVFGRPVNVAVACWNGKVLAQVCVEVLASNGATGAATVVKVIEHRGVSQAVELMTCRLKLSGLCGFDFILDSKDGSPQLIELNPRATQTCHLVSFDSKQPIDALFAQLQGLPIVHSHQGPNRGPVVLFPHGIVSNLTNLYAHCVHNDVPPELVYLGLELRRDKRRLLAEAIRRCRDIWSHRSGQYDVP
jgi:thioesterase domain-containing protein/carbamoylphosphate synthase large subunit